MNKHESRPDAYTIAAQFLADRYERDHESPIAREVWLRYWREDWYVYEGGCYSRIGLDELKAHIVGYLREHAIPIAMHFVNAVVLSLTHLCLVDSRQDMDTWLDGIHGAQVIPAANGNVSLTDRDKDGKPRLLPHTAHYFSMSRVPYNYDPAAECPLWQTFLADAMLGRQDCVDLLQEYAGYLFGPDLREHRFLLCVGPGANGKGVFAEVLEGLVGCQNASHVPLALFADKFALYGTLGKRLNITSEAIHMVEEQAESLLKSFVAGDAMTFERKFRDPVNAIPTAKVVICTNALPRFCDRTEGLWRRLLLVPWDKVVTADRQIKTLAAELKMELPGVLNWAIEGLDRLDAQAGFGIPSAHGALIDEYRRDSDPARAFLLDYCEPSPDGEFIVAKDLYAAYAGWAKECGYTALNERNFGHDLRRVFARATRRRLGTGLREWVYTGIRPVASQASQELPI